MTALLESRDTLGSTDERAGESTVLRRTRDSGFAVRRDYGQHFLRSREAAEYLADLVVRHASTSIVVEVGCGLGTLSAALIDRGLDFVGVERDERLTSRLAEVCREGQGRASLLIGDVFEMSLDDIVPGPWHLCGILPFDRHLCETMVYHILGTSAGVRSGLVVIPQTVADRVTGAIHTAGGSLSLKEEGRLSPWDFWPPAPEPLRIISLEHHAVSPGATEPAS